MVLCVFVRKRVCVCVYGCNSSVSPAGLLSLPTFPSPRWRYSQRNWSPSITFTPSGICGLKVDTLAHSKYFMHQLRSGSVCLCDALFWIYSYIVTNIPALQLQLCPRWEPDRRGGEARWAPPNTPSLSVKQLTRLKGPSTQTPFHRPEWTCLIYIHTLLHRGDPNLTMPQWLCPATLYLCVWERACVCVCECRGLFVLFNRRSCSVYSWNVCVCGCVFLLHICVCLCVLSLPLCSVVTQSSAFIFLS